MGTEPSMATGVHLKAMVSRDGKLQSPRLPIQEASALDRAGWHQPCSQALGCWGGSRTTCC